LVAVLVSPNLVSLDEEGVVLPVVPVGACRACCTQPVTVIALSAPCDLSVGLCDGDELGGFCARAAVVTPNTIAAHVADQNRIFIAPPVLDGSVGSGCNCGAASRIDRRKRHERTLFRSARVPLRHWRTLGSN